MAISKRCSGPCSSAMKIGACSNSCGQAVALGAELARRQDLLRRLGADDQHAADAARRGLVVDRAVAVGPVDVFDAAVARDRHQLVDVPGGAAAGHHLLDLRADDVPDLVPHLARRPAERARVALRADRVGDRRRCRGRRSSGPHQMYIGWPVLSMSRTAVRSDCGQRRGRAERRGGPVVSAHQRAHLPAFEQEVERASTRRPGGIRRPHATFRHRPPDRHCEVPVQSLQSAIFTGRHEGRVLRVDTGTRRLLAGLVPRKAGLVATPWEHCRRFA